MTAVYTGSYGDTNLETRAAIKSGKPRAAVITSANFVREYVINDDVDAFDPLIEKAGKTPDAFVARLPIENYPGRKTMLIRFASIISVVSLVACASPAQQATQQQPATAMYFGEPNYVYCPVGGVMPFHCPNPSSGGPEF